MRAKWFCCAFKLGFLQLIRKASLIFKSNLELALSIILKQRELCESKHVAEDYRCLKIQDLLSFLICLSACKKSTSSFRSFSRYYKEFATLLFWVLWTCLATASKNDVISLYKTLIFIFMQKIKLIPHLFLRISLRYCKLGILGSLGMYSHTHQKIVST